jgi:aminopeptidase N
VIDTFETDGSRLLDRNSYEKGAWVLHMLRTQLGDSAFFRGIRSYFQAHIYGNALSDDLRVALERASGRSLKAFFDQWLRRPGFPELTVRWRYDAERKGVILTVEQGTRFAPFALPLPIDVVDPAGQSRRTTVNIPAAPSTTLTIPVQGGSPPARLVYDPDVQVLATITESH